jgi:membrane protein
VAFLPAKIDSVVREKISGAGRVKALLRLFYILIEGFFDEQLSLKASGLVYITLLALVPLFTVSFALLKAFGVNTQLEITLYYFLEPLGERGTDISYNIIRFVEHMNIAVLGGVGLSVLMYTVVSTISRIESALNSIWNVRETRRLSQKFSNYLSTLLVGPVLGFTALSLIVSLKSAYVVTRLLSLPGIGSLVYILAKAFPYLLAWAAFTLIYIFLPNTRVTLRSALTGGGFAALSWGVIGWAFATFVASSSKYSAVYSGLAALFLFIRWLYWNWSILLAGARVAYYQQHPAHFFQGGADVTGRLRERTALQLVTLIARKFYSGEDPPNATSIAALLGIPADQFHSVTSSLIRAGILETACDDQPVYLFRKSPETITLAEVIKAVDTLPDDTGYHHALHPAEPAIEAVLTRMDNAVSGSLSAETVKDLIRGPGSTPSEND